MRPILFEIRTVHQVHAASVMVSINLDTSLGSLHHLSRECISCMLCIIGGQVFHSCRDDGIRFSACRSTPDTCFGDVLHLVRLPGKSLHSRCGDDPHRVSPLDRLSPARTVVMVLSLSGFSGIFSIIWTNLSLMVIPGKRSCPECSELNSTDSRRTPTQRDLLVVQRVARSQGCNTSLL